MGTTIQLTIQGCLQANKSDDAGMQAYPLGAGDGLLAMAHPSATLAA